MDAIRKPLERQEAIVFTLSLSDGEVLYDGPMDQDIPDNGSVTLCCGGKRCPVLKKSAMGDDLYDLTDDFGETVTLSRDQLNLIPGALDTLDD